MSITSAVTAPNHSVRLLGEQMGEQITPVGP
jgi:hypothetical protein